MTFKVLFYVTLISFTVLLPGCERQTENTRADGADRQVLRVAIDIDMPGYFDLDGESLGYQYDLLKAYADSRGLKLTVTHGNTANQCAAMLAGGKADIAATLSYGTEGMLAIPLYTTSYSVLALSRTARSIRPAGNAAAIIDAMASARVLISAGFKESASYGALIDSLPQAKLYVSSRASLELMDELRGGEYDFLICERSEAQLGCALTKGIAAVYDFGEDIAVNAVLDPADAELCADFTAWFDSYRKGKDYAMLAEQYLEKDKVVQLVHRISGEEPAHAISPYDRVMREVCEREGFDWRLISAIAYSESRFIPDVVSKSGAKGLMQIMPATARQFDVPQEDIFKPEINIMLATKLLGKIESMLRFPKATPVEERMKIILACYNCGIGHVLDARNLAAKYGANPNSWDDVSLFLQRKAEPEYNSDEVVRNGVFRGSKQTLAFVKTVMGRYNTYCSRVSR